MVMDGWSAEQDVADCFEGVLAGLPDGQVLVRIRLKAIYQFALFLAWKGNWESAWKLCAECEELTSGAMASPMARISALLLKSLLSYFAGLTDMCIQSVEMGLAIARDTGVHVQDHFLLAQAAGVWLETGFPENARPYLERLAKLEGHMQPWDRSIYNLLLARGHLVRGEHRSSRERHAVALALAERVGHPFAIGLLQPSAALISHHLGEAEAADACLDKGLLLASKGEYRTVACMNLLMRAGIGLLRGDTNAALEALAQALPLGKACCLHVSAGDTPDLASRLYALALDWDMETVHVQECVRRRQLPPCQEARSLEDWPWPVKIRTLGGFSMQAGDRPLTRTSKTPKKLLKMLQVLISHAGQPVQSADLMDEIWPDSPGDFAEQSLKNAVFKSISWVAGMAHV